MINLNPNSLFAHFITLCERRGVLIDETRIKALHDDLSDNGRWKFFCPRPLRAYYEDTEREDFFLDLLLCQMGQIGLATFGSMMDKLAFFRSLRSLTENEAIAELAIHEVATCENLLFGTLETLLRAIVAHSTPGDYDDAPEQLTLDRECNICIWPGTTQESLPERLSPERVHHLCDLLNRALYRLGFERDDSILLDTLLSALLNAPACYDHDATYLLAWYSRFDGHPILHENRVKIDEVTGHCVRVTEIERHYLFGHRADLVCVTECVHLHPSCESSFNPRYPFYTRHDGLSRQSLEVAPIFTFTYPRDSKMPQASDDDLIGMAVDYFQGHPSTYISQLQRVFNIGYNAASKLVEELVARSILTQPIGDEPYKSRIYVPSETPEPEPTPRTKKATTRKKKATP